MFTEKSLLFKLLAEENIRVVFANVRTAKFDTTSRVLTMPYLNIVSGSSTVDPELKLAILDCFGGHEVGHALHSPQVPEDYRTKWGVPFGYVNVVEDCRIERFVKSRYPGLKPIMYKAYRALFVMGWFGRDHSKYNLIDRINLFYKVGLAADVKFSAAERHLVKACSETMTFDEVLALAKKIYEFSKEQKENKKQEKSEPKTKKPEMEDGEEESDDNDSDDSDDNNDDAGESDDMSDGGSDDTDTDEDESSDGSDDKTNDDENDGETINDGFDPVDDGDNTDADVDVEHSKTQETFDGALEREADKSSKIFQFKYKIDKTLFSKIITEPKAIFDDSRIVSRLAGEIERNNMLSYYNNWMDNNNKVVNYLVKEFEMKRAAQALNRAVQHSTGLLNNKKLYAYKLTDEVFKRSTSLPNGKDHSLTILIDWSGSMDKYSKSALRQAITFANFCRRAQIPFNVYLFNGLDRDWKLSPELNVRDTLSEDEISIGDVRLVRVLHSNMTNSEFTQMSKILFANINVGLLQRGMTPLNSALLVVKDLMKDLVAANKTEKNTLIILSDGANTESLSIKDIMVAYGSKMYMINPNNNLSYEVSAAQSTMWMTENVMKMVKDELKINIMWLFLSDSLNSSDAIRFRAKRASSPEMKTFNANGFINHTLRGDGVDVCQIINNKHLAKIDDIERGINTKTNTKGALKNAFSKMMTASIINKTLLNQWIKVINQ